METMILNERDYYNKVLGGWMGKNIGGTLGGPVEGTKQLLELTYYPKLMEAPIPNDDLDLQLVWLHALEQYGARLTADELGQEWVEHIFFPFDEYGYAITNLRKGLKPPISGWFNNPFADCMGSPIRSEIWAMVTPGAPGLAAYYAYQDAIVDHAGGEGVYGEMFFAALESSAFFESDKDKLLDIGLTYIPADCRTAAAVKDLRKWHREGLGWKEAREKILQFHGRSNFTDAPQNIAFTILGWLYGEDFGDAIVKAVNCGYDTDCTGATLGAILGILQGPESFPEKWVKPLGDRIAVSSPVKGFHAPTDLQELTERTIKAGKEVLAAWNVPVQIDTRHATSFRQGVLNLDGQMQGDFNPKSLWDYDVCVNRFRLPRGSTVNQGLEVSIRFGKEGPTVGRHQKKEMVFELWNQTREGWTGWLELEVPCGWKTQEKFRFEAGPHERISWKTVVDTDGQIQSAYPLALKIYREHDDSIWNVESVRFVVLSANSWRVLAPGMKEEKEILCSGNRIEFEKVMDTERKGVYRARTTLLNPQSRRVRLIAGTASPVKVLLDGEIILDCAEKTDFMPAYHRAPEAKCTEIDLPEGRYPMEVEITREDIPLDIYVLPVSTAKTKKPGPFYYFTDILFI